MPRVPRLTQNQVQESGIPSVRVSDGATEETFGGGAGVQNVTNAARGLSENLLKYHAQQQRNADEIAVQDADLQAGQLETNLQLEANKMRGKDAAGAIDMVNDQWTKNTAEIKKGLTNDRQRQVFDKRAGARYLSLNQRIQTHMAQEFETYDRQNTLAYLDNAQQQAVLNYARPEDVGRSMFEQQETIKAYSARNGLSEAVTKQMTSDAANKTHVGVLNRMLADGNVTLARDYFGKVKGEIVGPEADRITKAITDEGRKIDAQATASDLLAKSKNDTEIEAGVLKIPDEKMRDEVKKQVEAQIRARDTNFNHSEAEIAGKIANGQYTPEQLEKDKTGISPEFYKGVSESFKKNTADLGSVDSHAQKYIDLTNKYAKLNSNPDVYGRAKALMGFRKEVINEKANLANDRFTQLLSWTSDTQFIEKQRPKRNWIQAGIDYINHHFINVAKSSAVSPDDHAAALDAFVTTAQGDAAKSPQDIQTVAKDVVRAEVLKNNPALVGKEDVTNATVTAEDGFKRIYDGKSAAKSDFTINPNKVPEGMVIMVSPTGRSGLVPKERVKEAEAKGYRQNAK